MNDPKQSPSPKHSYGQILKSSALIGGTSMLNIGLGIARNKAMALMLGPAGFGLMGLYTSIVDVTQSIAGLGINSSGVRQIAEAVGSGESERIARTVTVLRRASVLLGLFGAILLIALSGQVAKLTFGNKQHMFGVALLSLAVFFRLVSAGQGALLQAMRRIPDLARVGVLGGIFGTIISVATVYALGEDGVVPALVGISAMSVITSWWYSRRVHVSRPDMTLSEVAHEISPLLKLGIAFMLSSFLTMGAAYAVRTMVLRTVSVEAAGLYQAAWTLGGLYVGFILGAMSADFYPRLTAVANQDSECNRLVNEQAHVGMLMAGPGVIATIALAPIIVAVLYSSQFTASTGLLRWFCLGMTLRVITWPMGFILIAKNRQILFLATDFAWTATNLGLSLICLRYFGLDGAGIAFFVSYIFHGLFVYPLVRWLSGFRWSMANLRTGFLFLLIIGVVFGSTFILPSAIAVAVGLLGAVLAGVYSLRTLVELVPLERLPGTVRRLLVWLRFVPRV